MAASNFFFITLFVFVFITEVLTVSLHGRSDSSDVCNTDACKESAKALKDSIKTDVQPCDDFFKYTCGGWLEKNPIPPSDNMYSTMYEIYLKVAERVKTILTNPPEKPTSSKAVANTQILYRGCMNEAARDNSGVQPVKDLLVELGGWPLLGSNWKKEDYAWTNFLPKAIRKFGTDALLSISSDSDSKNVEKYILYFDQPAFTVGRNEMINMTASERSIEMTTAYKNYIIRSAKLLHTTLSDEELKQEVDAIVNFESELAKLTRSKEERRDHKTMYNKMKVADLQRETQDSSFDWKAFINAVLSDFTPVDDTTDVVVKEVNYIKRMLELVKNTDAKLLANFIGWKVILEVGRSSTSEFRDAKYQFDKVHTGLKEAPELYKICSQDIVSLLGFAVGRLYVDKYFADEAKKDMDALVAMLHKAYAKTLTDATWMDEDTKKSALEKLSEMVDMIGYPEWITDDAKLDEYHAALPVMDENSYFTSFVKAQNAMTGKHLKRWNEKRNRTEEWIAEPPVMNAFYNPDANSITFPAAILSPPLYQFNREQSLNYGGIGMAIGHEIIHGFDDQGSQYDKYGYLRNWWSNNTREQFTNLADCFKEQYNEIVEPATGLNLNGENTLGENIADNGALKNAYKAYKMFLAENKDYVPRQLPDLDATPDQQFFLSFALMWCGAERKKYLQTAIPYDEHSPNMYRVLVPLKNSEEFAAAFNCPVGSEMNPKKKCVMW